MWFYTLWPIYQLKSHQAIELGLVPYTADALRVACGCGGERPASHTAHATSAAAVESAADSAKERRPLRFRFRAPGASISIHLAVVESVCGLGAGGNEDLAWVYLDDRIGAQQLQGQQPYVDLACSTRLQLPQRTWPIEVVDLSSSPASYRSTIGYPQVP